MMHFLLVYFSLDQDGVARTITRASATLLQHKHFLHRCELIEPLFPAFLVFPERIVEYAIDFRMSFGMSF